MISSSMYLKPGYQNILGYLTTFVVRSIRYLEIGSHTLSTLQLLHGKVGPHLLRAGAGWIRQMLCVNSEAVCGIADAIALQNLISH